MPSLRPAQRATKFCVALAETQSLAAVVACATATTIVPLSTYANSVKLAIARNVPLLFAVHGAATQLAKPAVEREAFVECATRSRRVELQRSGVLPAARQSTCCIEHLVWRGCLS